MHATLDLCGTDGGQCRARTCDLLLVRHGVQKSKCRFWCRLRGNSPLISPLSWTEHGLAPPPGRPVCGSASLVGTPLDGRRGFRGSGAVGAPKNDGGSGKSRG